MPTCYVANALKAVQKLPRLGLNNIRNFENAFAKYQRIGRGPGSGRGLFSGRGNKGQKARGTQTYFGFEGGQTRFYLRFPKFGMRSKNRVKYNLLDLGKLQNMVETGRLDNSKLITLEMLYFSGAASCTSRGVKLTATGKYFFNVKVDIEVNRATKEAIVAIEKAGGSITTIYRSRLSLRVMLHPERFHGRVVPHHARPPPKEMIYYADPKNRGYLAKKHWRIINPPLAEKLARGETVEGLPPVTDPKLYPIFQKSTKFTVREKLYSNPARRIIRVRRRYVWRKSCRDKERQRRQGPTKMYKRNLHDKNRQKYKRRSSMRKNRYRRIHVAKSKIVRLRKEKLQAKMRRRAKQSAA